MGLFQPTNISPSLWGELGDGVIDIARNIPISWQVNGDTAMTAYQIDIYRNNAASTLVRTTGKVVLTTPFYGKDYNGNITRFSVSIAPQSGISYGQQYKMKITQWWGAASDNEKIEQTSLSAFIVRQDPVLTLGAISSPITTRNATFTATYTQAQGDSINYVRWKMLWSNGGEQVALKDTGNLYGVAQLQFDYDGFFTGQAYIIYCEVQTQNGVVVTASRAFTVSYTTRAISGYVNTEQRTDLHGIKVKWPHIYDIVGVASNTSYTSGNIRLLSSSTLNYQNVNNQAMAISGEWTALFNISTATTGTSATMYLYFNSGNGWLKISVNSVSASLIQFRFEYREDGTTTVSGLYLRNFGSSVLFALAHTFERDTAAYTGKYKLFAVGNSTQQTVPTLLNLNTTGDGTLSRIYFAGKQDIKDVAVMSKAIIENDLKPYYNTVPQRDDDTILLTKFAQSTLDAGNYDLGGSTITGYDLYRTDGSEVIMKKIATLSQYKNSVVDCSVPSQVNAVYTLFMNGSTNSSGLASQPITPCLWNWAIMECTQNADGTYHPVNIFLFGKNLDSGTVSNNNSPNILQNFTQFPTVQRSPQNYMGGTLQSYIGTIDKYTAEYSDTLAQRNAINNLSVTENTLFLKSRKGDVFPIRIAGAIGFSTIDGSKVQALNASVPWVQIGEIGDDSIILTDSDSLFPAE